MLSPTSPLAQQAELGSSAQRAFAAAPPPGSTRTFLARFDSRHQAINYRDRYKTGRRARMDQKERQAMRALLRPLGPLAVALDIPAGTGRLTPVLAESAEQVILADASPMMLELAREQFGASAAVYLPTDAENIALPDQSIDLVFCHRLLHHLHDSRLRARILAELTRVSRRFVLLSYYTPGFRDRIRWWTGRLTGRSRTSNRPVLKRRFLSETASAGLMPVDMCALRRFPLAAEFFLFEKGEC